MTTEYSHEQIEAFDQEWSDWFALKRGWEEQQMAEPIDDLRLFFDQLSGTEMLDSGCGWGRYIYRFTDAGLTYTGLDHSCEMLLVAEATNLGLKFVQASFRKMPFRSENFDGIWSCCALSAVPKKYLADVLREHQRVLKPGGIIMIVLPAVYGSDEILYDDDEDGGPKIYQAHYDLDEFARYIINADLEIIEADYRLRAGSMYFLAKKPA